MARTNAAFVLIIALLLISINLQLDNFKLFSSSPLSISLSAEKYRLLSTEEKRDHLDQAEQTQFRNKHSENSNQKKNEGRTRNDSDQRHLYRWKNPTTGLQYKKRWIHRFRQATRRNNLGGIFFFRHIRKVSLGKSTSIILSCQFLMTFSIIVFEISFIFACSIPISSFDSSSFSLLFLLNHRNTPQQFPLRNNCPPLGRRHIS